MKRVKLTVVKYTFKNWKSDPKPKTCYWIEGLPYEECQRTRAGPYESYAEAKSDRDGMQQHF